MSRRFWTIRANPVFISGERVLGPCPCRACPGPLGLWRLMKPHWPGSSCRLARIEPSPERSQRPSSNINYGGQSFLTLAPSTQRPLRGILEHFRAEHGDKSIASLQRQHVVALLNSKKRFAARHWLKAIRALMNYAIEIGLRSDNPAAGVKLPNLKTDGYHSWTEPEIEQFQERHGLGTKARLALELLLCTGQRRGDVVRLGRQHIRDGFIYIRQHPPAKDRHGACHTYSCITCRHHSRNAGPSLDLFDHTDRQTVQRGWIWQLVS